MTLDVEDMGTVYTVTGTLDDRTHRFWPDDIAPTPPMERWSLVVDKAAHEAERRRIDALYERAEWLGWA